MHAGLHAASDDVRRKQERRERFNREKKNPPPPPPVKRLAHPGGKIVTSDKDACLLKLIARKQAAGEELNEAQKRALQNLTNGAVAEASVSSSQLSVKVVAKPTVHEPVVKRAVHEPVAPAAPTIVFTDRPALPAVSKRIKALRKKLHECEELEKRALDGAVLQANQKAKLESKAAVVEELARLEAE